MDQAVVENVLDISPVSQLKVDSYKRFHFIVVGAGGTGGFLIPNLARLLAQPRNNHHNMTIIDGDEVEEKNLIRQNFVQNDIGKNKASVHAQRYSGAFGISINSVESYIEDKDVFNQIIESQDGTPVIIGCVDNNRTRQLIHSVFESSPTMFWIDGGNEEWSGQVVVGHKSIFGRKLTDHKYEPDYFDVPPVTEVYPEILEDTEAQFNSELSCAELAVSAPQTMAANLTSSNIIMNIISTMLSADENRGLSVHEVQFNTRTNSYTTSFNSPERFKEIYENID